MFIDAFIASIGWEIGKFALAMALGAAMLAVVFAWELINQWRKSR